MLIVKTKFLATLSLSDLTPKVGFSVSGVRLGESGYSVKGIGDINADGIDDVVVVPYASGGVSCVVFGAHGIGQTGTLALKNLNGQNGFNITGINPGDNRGNSVSVAGDVNGDGIADVIIGNPYVNDNTGVSYVVFGARGIGQTGTLVLKDLNGQNGFNITGINPGDWCGTSVSAAGDVNGDGIADVIIGAPNANKSAGASYVVFGARGISWAGTLTVKDLNGQNGFKITNDNDGWSLGRSVSTAGDVNGDGIADVIIGAPYANKNAGASYVVFGARGIGQTGTLLLKDLNGQNGFNITGINPGDTCGTSVSTAGDVNGDGIADVIIGAPNANKSAGASYVVFGARGIGQTGTLVLKDLNGQNGFNVTGFNFNIDSFWGSRCGSSVSTAGDVNGDGIADMIIEAPYANNNVGASYVVFGDPISYLTSNALTITKGQTILLNCSHFNATTNINSTDNSKIHFNLHYVLHGYFSYNNAPSQPIVSFQQQDINEKTVRFTHDGSEFAPIFGTQIGFGGLALMNLQWANITSMLLASSVVSTSFFSKFDLAALTPQTGFSITTDINDYNTRFSVSAAGDINGDGIVDVIIGAPDLGTSYVVFGARNIGNSGALRLNHLNGQNGFKITNGNGGWSLGRSVSTAGDVNGDGIADVIIGAPYANEFVGASYVVFGKRGIGQTGTLVLKDLNGQNGFNVTGFFPPDFGTFPQGGWSVSTTGDVNGDGIADIIIGARNRGYNPGSYVVFGARGISWAGTLAVKDLNGQNGFNIYNGGQSVSSAGDVNGDGIADVIITDVNIAYVVFGAHNIGNSGWLALSGLNGQNGFKIISDNSRDVSDWSVSTAGDVNGDGIADVIIGATYVKTNARGYGASYVVFGAHNIGGSGALKLSDLNGQNGFNITGIIGDDRLGISVSTAGDVNNDGFSDLIIQLSHAYNVGASYIVFGASNIGNSGTLSLNKLNGQNGFSISGASLTGGVDRSVGTAGDLNDDGITDVIIGASGIGGYILFGSPTALLICNTLMLTKGHTILLNSADLCAAYAINLLSKDPNIRFTITNIQYGHFSFVNNPSFGISSFLQQDILNKQIQFIHDNSEFPPVFSTQLLGNGGLASMSPQPASITFIHQGGKLIRNTLTIDQGKTTTVLFTELNAVNLDNPSENFQLIFLTDTPQHGYFRYNYNPGFNITQFTLNDIRSGFVQFIHDGSIHAPNYTISVNDGTTLSSPPEAVKANFFLTPIVVNNTLTVKQGGRVVLTSNELGAYNPRINASSLLFTTTNVPQGGYFQNADGMETSFFTQAQINNASVVFVQDGTDTAPKYTLSVSNGRLGVFVNVPSNVTFIPASPDSHAAKAVKDAIIGGVVSGVVGLMFLAAKLGITYYVNNRLKAAFEQESATESDKKRAALVHDVITPAVERVFSQLNTSYFMGFRTDSDTREYVAAIELLVTQLHEKGVDLDMYDKPAGYQVRLLNEIIRQIKRVLLPERSYCSCAYLVSFFTPDIKPQDIDEKIHVIAEAVAVALKKPEYRDSTSSDLLQDVELNELKQQPLNPSGAAAAAASAPIGLRTPAEEPPASPGAPRPELGARIANVVPSATAETELYSEFEL